MESFMSGITNAGSILEDMPKGCYGAILRIDTNTNIGIHTVVQQVSLFLTENKCTDRFRGIQVRPFTMRGRADLVGCAEVIIILEIRK